jgi:uncharacterized protein YndB with AHSA1/START domain
MPSANQSAARLQATDDRVLRISRRLKAPRALVFKVFTDPAHLVRWFGPEGFTVAACKVEARIGGKFYVDMRSPEGKPHRISGRFQAVDVHSRLVMTWAWLDEADKPGHETLLTLTFEKVGDETELLLLQENFQDVETRDSHNQGWSSCFNCLEQYLAAQQG